MQRQRRQYRMIIRFHVVNAERAFEAGLLSREQLKTMRELGSAAEAVQLASFESKHHYANSKNRSNLGIDLGIEPTN
jgi:hypothetical protein